MGDEIEAKHRLLAEIVAGHIPGARVQGHEIDLGFGGLRAACKVEACKGPTPSIAAAALWISFLGGDVAPVAVPMSVSGYGRNEQEAIVEGGHAWSTAFGPMFRAAFAGDSADPSVFVDTASLHGQSFKVFVARMDRAMTFGDEDRGDVLRAERARLAGPNGWLTLALLRAGGLPVLPSDRPVIVSAFATSSAGGVLVEVKVDGREWPAASRVFSDLALPMQPYIALLRELAVLIPQEPTAPSREALEGTLRDLPRPFPYGPRASASWRGWRAHRGVLQAPFSDAELAEVERSIGPLPDDYRRFLRTIARGGAGPGYGLIAPRPSSRPVTLRESHGIVIGRSLVLATAGCSVVWLLVLDGKYRGQVWVDATSSDRSIKSVAPSFEAWWRAWLQDCVRDRFPAITWNSGCCAVAQSYDSVFHQLEELKVPRERWPDIVATSPEPGGFAITSCGGAYFNDNDPLDPCAGCTALMMRLGAPDDRIPDGIPPLQAR